jgi:uncharacterized protein
MTSEAPGTELRSYTNPAMVLRRLALSLLITSLLVSSLFVSSTFAQTSKALAAVTQDPPADASHPASMVEFAIPSHGANLNGVLYLASGKGPHGLVILLHGFPGYERNLDVAQSVRRAGWDALVFHYRGAWGSPGDFSFANSMQDTEAAVAYMRSAAVTSKYAIDPKRIVLLGHSMGGFMASYAASRDPQIAGVILLAAWNIGSTPMTNPDMRKQAVTGFVDELRPLHGATAEGLVEEIEHNPKAWDYIAYAPALKTLPVFVVSTNDDLRQSNEAFYAALQKAGATRAKYAHFDTDHGFSDKRIALQTAVVEWLGSL